MFGELSEKAKRKIVGKQPNFIRKFDVSEYIQNPPMIEKLQEEKQLALTAFFELDEKVKSLSEKTHDLELRNQKLSLQLGESKRQQITIFGLSLIATIFLGIGINVATDEPYAWIGWVLIISSVILESFSFFQLFRQRP